MPLSATVASLAGLLIAPLCVPQPGAGDLHARPRLVTEQAVATPGETIWLAIDFSIDDGWHTYWPGINDTGFALDAEIETSGNVVLGEPVWSAPTRFLATGDILDHGFEERMTVLYPLEVDPEARWGDRVSIDMNARWLVCQRMCVLEEADLSIQIPIEQAIGKPSREHAELFERARARIPEPVTPESPFEVVFEDGTLTVSGKNAERLAFYPWTDCRPPRNLLAEGATETGMLRMEFREGDAPVRGVLEVWTSEDDSRVFSIEIPEPAEAASQTGDE